MGVMGQTLLKGLLNARAIAPSQAWGTSRSRATCDKVAAALGVAVEPDISSHLAQTDVVLLCVKPAQAAVALNTLKSTPGLRPDALLISIVAGVRLRDLAAALGTTNPWVRAMPNTPCVVGEGMTAIAGGEHATSAHLARTRQVFECVGSCIETDERHFNAITALSGADPRITT
jgi:pyrroline-5-carboxylate reductase